MAAELTGEPHPVMQIIADEKPGMILQIAGASTPGLPERCLVHIWTYVLTACSWAPYLARINGTFFLLEFSDDVKKLVQFRVMLYGIEIISRELHCFLSPRPPQAWTTVTHKGLHDFAMLLVTITAVVFMWTLTEYDSKNIRLYGLAADLLFLANSHETRIVRLSRRIYSFFRPMKAFWLGLSLLVVWYIEALLSKRIVLSINDGVWCALIFEVVLDTLVRISKVEAAVRGRVGE